MESKAHATDRESDLHAVNRVYAMRHLKLVIVLVVLVVGGLILFGIAARDTAVRGQDPNVETRGTNTAGVPLAGTSGTTDPTAASSSGHDGRTGPAVEGAGFWRGDAGFVAEAAEMNVMEAALAGLAGRRATSEEVRQFASALRTDHKAASDELKALAGSKRWAYPRSMDSLQTQALQALDRSQGPEFDRAFVDAMVSSHERAIRSFTMAAASAADPELKAFAQKQLPVLHAHLRRARSLK